MRSPSDLQVPARRQKEEVGDQRRVCLQLVARWDFPKIRGTFWGPHGKDYSIWEAILESPLRKLPDGFQGWGKLRRRKQAKASSLRGLGLRLF